MEQIVNCHSHIFTLQHVPNKFIALPISFLSKKGRARKLAKLLHYINPFSDNDIFDRYSSFVAQGDQAGQETVLKNLMRFYPPCTRFVVLSMDFEFMGAGKPKVGFTEQLDELARLKAMPEYANVLMPFMAVDPRRENLLHLVKHYIEEKGFAGLKLYPPLGFYPFDARLDPVYAYAEKNKLPIMVHCSTGGVYYKGRIPDEWLIHPLTGERLKRTSDMREFCHTFSQPTNYTPVFEKHPDLKLCFGHFGGADQWKLYASDPDEADYKKSWTYTILQYLRNEAYANVYADISYAISKVNDSAELLDPLMLDLLHTFLYDDKINNNILFGSDFYMANIEGGEYKFSIRLRRSLGETQFEHIAVQNPKTYLNL